jgi:hypothetical protein
MDSEQVESGQVYRSPRKPSKVPLTEGTVGEPPCTKRQILKNIAIFLLMCNISVRFSSMLSVAGCA